MKTIAPNPWPGLASYTEEDRHLFFGRDAEINEVTRLVGRETLTVLFGRSGLGKSSLLRAGVMPRLREQGFFPVTLRLDFSERSERTPVEQVKALTLAAAQAAGVEAENVPTNAAALTLWEWFHAVEFWGPRNDPVTPILALDQFEEVFTLGRNLGRTDEFIEQFADLVENRVPQIVRDRAATSGERLAYDATQHGYKVILSLREDFVPRLDSLRPVLPAVMRNRFALAPLDSKCAVTVVLGAGRTWISDADAQEIVAAVVGGEGPLTYRPDAEVEPAYLSVMCHELFRRMQALGRDRITTDLIEAERGGILEGLYTRSFEGIGDPVRFFVEDRLLTPSGYRGTLPLADAAQEGIAEGDLRTLVDRRLLRFEDRLGTIHMELSHALLPRIVLRRRESRRAEAALRVETERAQTFRAAQLRQRRRSHLIMGVAIALAVLLVGTVWGGYYCFVQEHRASYRSAGMRRGFPVGIGPLSAAQASRLPLHYVMCYRGVTWDGWHPHWRPVYRFMAVDGRGHLTTNHGVGTFFWRAHDDASAADLNKERGQELGLSAVCQWEFSADAAGGIAYGRGLDRDGRMVWGCLYSPSATGSDSVRIAHYVGPDGFPQLQNKSAAEYIEVHYNAQGYEERILFLDAMARPAAGPDGEFGSAREYDPAGNLVQTTTLDEHGRPMFDHQGDAGMRGVCNADGLYEEGTALGLDGQPAANTDGWTRFRVHYDEYGRRTLVESFDAADHPVLRRAGFSGIRNEYDEHGGLVRETYLGTDGQPRPFLGKITSVRHELDAEGNDVHTSFLDAAGEPACLADGSCGSLSSYDERRDLVARTALGPDGQPFLLADGWASWRSEYEAGREVRTTYYGVAGEPVLTKQGYHGYQVQYDARGNAVRYTYLGRDGQPAFMNTGIAGWAAEFDQRGRETSRVYFGPMGEPVLHNDGNHGITTGYDENGYEAEITYVDLAGKPVATSEHFAIQKLQHDTRGRETRRTYFGADGKPVAHKDGYGGKLLGHDERGNVSEITTLNTDGRPAAPKAGGYAREVRLYDGRGDLVGQRFFDAAGAPASDANGFYGLSYRHDARGNTVEETGEGQQPGEPAAGHSGITRWRYEYDAWNRRTREATFGLQNEPVPGMDGACVEVKRFNEHGNWLGSTWLDPAGQPAPCKQGYSSVTVKYDERSRRVEQTYLDAAGQPATGSDKTHRWTKRYDDHDNVARRDFFDTSGRLTVGAGEYAAEEWDHDARGKETRTTYLGPDSKPTMQPAGYATIRRAYTSAGLETRTDYLDDHGEPVLSNAGSCSLVRAYDEVGRLRTQTWVGVPGQTAESTAIRTYRNGLPVLTRYQDANGKLVNSAYGYAQEDKDYDEAGAITRAAYHDAAGTPVCGPYGYASATVVSKVVTYYDRAGRASDDNNHRTTRPLVCITFLRPADCTALRAGLRPGDLLWQIGDLSLPQVVAERWDKPRADEEAQDAILEACKAALAPKNAGPVHIAVLRDERVVEFDLPETPAAGPGVHVDTRLVPTAEYEAMVTRYGVKR